MYSLNSLVLPVDSLCRCRFAHVCVREVTDLELEHVCLVLRQFTSKQVTFVVNSPGLIEREENYALSRLFMKSSI